MCLVKVNRFFIVRFFRIVSVLVCLEYFKIRDIVRMEILWGLVRGNLKLVAAGVIVFIVCEFRVVFS